MRQVGWRMGWTILPGGVKRIHGVNLGVRAGGSLWQTLGREETEPVCSI